MSSVCRSCMRSAASNGAAVGDAWPPCCGAGTHAAASTRRRHAKPRLTTSDGRTVPCYALPGTRRDASSVPAARDRTESTYGTRGRLQRSTWRGPERRADSCRGGRDEKRDREQRQRNANERALRDHPQEQEDRRRRQPRGAPPPRFRSVPAEQQSADAERNGDDERTAPQVRAVVRRPVSAHLEDREERRREEARGNERVRADDHGTHGPVSPGPPEDWPEDQRQELHEGACHRASDAKRHECTPRGQRAAC